MLRRSRPGHHHWPAQAERRGLGRRAWLFAGSDRGGGRAADAYSLIVTAKLNDVDPRAWLADVFAGSEITPTAASPYPPGEGGLPRVNWLGDLSGDCTSAVKIRGRLDGDYHRR